MTTNNNDPKQTLWEMWFILSIILIGMLIILGSTNGSKETIPDYPYYVLLSVVNFVMCVVVGRR